MRQALGMSAKDIHCHEYILHRFLLGNFTLLIGQADGELFEKELDMSVGFFKSVIILCCLFVAAFGSNDKKD